MRISDWSSDVCSSDLVTANTSALPSATATAEAIRAAIRAETQLTASAGVAPNKFVAKIASDFRKPDGLFVVRHRQVEAFLAPLPVGRLPGVGKVMEQRLGTLGLHIVADLPSHPVEDLRRLFGRWIPEDRSYGNECDDTRRTS